MCIHLLLSVSLEFDNFQPLNPAFPKNYQSEKRQNLWPYKSDFENVDYEELEKQNLQGKRENIMKDQNPWGKRQKGRREIQY